MKSLFYILIHTLKNRLLELRRKPGKLVLYLLVIAMLIFVLSTSSSSNSSPESFADIMWLKGVVFALLLFFFVTAIRQGLSSGTTLFNMEDVNLLFVSPIKPQSILLYGVTRMMNTILLSSVFILYNASTLKSFFNINLGGVLIVFAAVILTSAVTQLLTLVIYSLTNGNPRRKLLVKVFSAIIFAPVAIAAAWHIQASGWDYNAGLIALMRSPVTSFTPVVGWASSGAVALAAGQYAAGALFFGMLAMTVAVLVIVIYIGNPDYYEALSST